MIVDYRLYLTIYALCFALHLAAFPAIKWQGGKWFYPLEMVAIGGACLAGLTNFLDWLWS